MAKMKPVKLEDGSNISGFALQRVIVQCKRELIAAGKHDAAYYFEAFEDWLKEDVFGHGDKFEYSNRILNL